MSGGRYRGLYKKVRHLRNRKSLPLEKYWALPLKRTHRGNGLSSVSSICTKCKMLHFLASCDHICKLYVGFDIGEPALYADPMMAKDGRNKGTAE